MWVDDSTCKASENMNLQIAQAVRCTEAEGPGRRYAIWFQGCPLRCASCCNPEMLPFEGGDQIACDDLVADVLLTKGDAGIEGVTLLGGEPFAHASGASEFASRVRGLGLSVMIFTGYTLEELRSRDEANVQALLDETDLLVDGPYIRDQPEYRRRWIGSANQRIHFLSDRYSPDDPCWDEPNTLEIRIENGELSVNGFPSRDSIGLWKRP